MAVRKIPVQGWGQRGLFWSLKNGRRHVPYESMLEYDFCVCLEFDPFVEVFESQPLAVDFVRAPNRCCRGFPDFLVSIRKGGLQSLELYDVKYRSDIKAHWAHLKPRFRAASDYAKANGMVYRLSSEVEIRTPFLSNGKRLLRYLRDGSDPAFERVLLSTVTGATPQTLGQLLDSAFSSKQQRTEALPTLWNLVARRLVDVDLRQALTMQSLIRREPA